MRSFLFAIMAFGLGRSCTVSHARAETWKPAPSPLKTRYAEKVSTREIPLYEFYPRPMMTRHKEGNWWSTLFGGDTPEVLGPLKEQPGILRVEFAPDGTIQPVDPRL